MIRVSSRRTTYYMLGIMAVCPWLVSSYASERQSKPSQCEAQLPEGLRNELAKSHGAWRIIDRSDLTKDDQAITLSECPGIVLGAFGPKSEAVAILMGRPSNGRYRVLLLLAKPDAKADYKLIELLSEDVYRYPIIYKGRPGVYTDIHDERNAVAVESETLIYEQVEASAKAFYVDRGTYRYVLISD